MSFEKNLNSMKLLPIQQKIFLVLSLLIFLANASTQENNTYPAFFIVLLTSFALPVFSKKFRQMFAKNFDLKIFFVLTVGIVLRLNYSLFGFLHLNYHGTYYLHSISRMLGFEEIPYGFTYNIFWYPLKYFIGLSSEKLFYSNLLLNIITAYLLSVLTFQWFKEKRIVLAITMLFILSPLQVAIAATESHFILCSFFLIYLLLLNENKNEPIIASTLPFALAFMTFIRPGFFFIFPAYLFYTYRQKNLKKETFIYLSLAYFLMIIVPLSSALLTLKDVFLSNNSLLQSKPFETHLALNLFNPKYYFPAFPILVTFGIFFSFRKFSREKLFSLLPIIALVFIEAIIKHSYWHISIYYQTMIEIMYFIFIGVFLLNVEKLGPKIKLLSYLLLLVLVIYQFASRINIYNQKFDEQVESQWTESVLPEIYRSKDVIFTSYNLNGDSEIFNPYLFYNESLEVQSLVVLIDQVLDPAFLKNADMNFPGRKIFYRSLSVPDDLFAKIESERGLQALKTYSFVFHQRFHSHIAEGSSVNVGFYLMTK